MTQLTIELDDDLLRKIQDSAGRENLSPNRWVARLLHRMLQEDQYAQNGWPQALINVAGAWSDFPTLEEIRSGAGEDVPRETW